MHKQQLSICLTALLLSLLHQHNHSQVSFSHSSLSLFLCLFSPAVLSDEYIYAWVLTIRRSTCGYITDPKAFLCKTLQAAVSAYMRARQKCFRSKSKWLKNIKSSIDKPQQGLTHPLTWNYVVCQFTSIMSWLHYWNGMWHDLRLGALILIIPPYFFFMHLSTALRRACRRTTIKFFNPNQPYLIQKHKHLF